MLYLPFLLWYTLRIVVEIYEISKSLTFILTDTKILVKTPLQTNLVIHTSGNYTRQWKQLREKIRNNRIKSISELIEFNRTRIGGVSQFQGLMLVNTEFERHVCLTS